jgi:hypothetical protein
VVAFGVELGLTRREVLATAERFVKWYTARPERAPADFTAAFCGRIWLERDAARKAAAKRTTSARNSTAENSAVDERDDDEIERADDDHDIDDDGNAGWWSDHARNDAYADVPF